MAATGSSAGKARQRRIICGCAGHQQDSNVGCAITVSHQRGDGRLDGDGLDRDILLAGGADYPYEANSETLLVVQIATPQAVANVDEIAAVAGVDGLFIGPGDLGLRIKKTAADLTLDDAVKKVAAAAKRHGKAWGCPAASVDKVKEFREQGAQLLAHGGEFHAFMNMLAKNSSVLNEVYGN